jgi:hypothetical protein
LDERTLEVREQEDIFERRYHRIRDVVRETPEAEKRGDENEWDDEIPGKQGG